MDMYYRDSIMEVDLGRLRSNAKIIREQLAKDKFLYGIVKGNGCGCGIVEFTRILVEEKCDGIGVATLDEAVLVRKYYPNIPLLILGAIRKCDILMCSEMGITITIPNLEFAEYLSEFNLNNKLKVHIKLNTGMNRLGVNGIEEVNKAVELLQMNNQIDIEGLFTHFATSDYINESEKDYFENQIKLFIKILEQLEYPFRQIHCTNSAALLRFSNELSPYCNVVRLLATYAGGLDDQCQVDYGIIPIISIKTKITHVAQYPKGTLLGYSNAYKITKDNSYTVIIPIGYADGLDRMLTGTMVRCNDQYGYVVGRICMDQTILEFENLVNIEDEVIILDYDDPKIDIFQKAKELNINPAALLEKFSIRLPKVYVENNKVVKVENIFLKQ